MTTDLNELGWDAGWAQAHSELARGAMEPARVSAEHRDAFVVHAAGGERRAEPAGRLWLAIEANESMRPAVGDWVAVTASPQASPTTIHAVLPRRTCIARKAPGRRTREQILAANIDVLFVTAALDRAFNARAVERYLTLVWDCGARPVVLLTKDDQSSATAHAVAAAATAAPGVPIHTLSALHGQGVDAVRAELPRGITGALLGPSGAGKSTLVNALLGENRLAVGAVREEDARGRHTTVTRQLLLLPGGGMIVDTPGLRELQLWDGEQGVERAFEDLEALARDCRFADCQHESEPGCAVQAAVREGNLDPGRLENRRKLEREMDHLAAKRDAALRAERNREVRKIHAQYDALKKHRANRGGRNKV